MTYRTPSNLDLNRRSVLKGAAASGLAAGLIGVASGPARAAPSRGGTFRVGVHDGSSTDSWDPATTASILMIHSSHVARAYLTEITNENTLGPDVATDWQALSKDGSEWRFELSRNATFHDGRAVTAKDVIASMNHHRGPDTTSAVAPLLSDVTDIRADGEHAVIFTLSTG
ncbi:MAG TPA: ABC transporter substrate-binding protein, partial [Roseovarius sp.]|nr:ABC transporter substrate-binding protein [Roseovarius sp.]